MHHRDMNTLLPPVSIHSSATAASPARSSLFKWMTANYEMIASLVDGLARVNWEPIRALATEQGILSEQGTELSNKKMWRLWPKVRKAHLRRLHATAKLLAGNPVQQVPIPVNETPLAETPWETVTPAPTRIAPIDQKPVLGTWLGRSLKANPNRADSNVVERKDSPGLASRNSTPVAPIGTKVVPESSPEDGGQTPADAPKENSMDRAIRQMQERANRRMGIF